MAEKICFFVAPIGEEGSPERKRSDQVLRHIIEPTLAPFGYRQENVVRADKIAKPGFITSQIIDLLFSSDLVIADLTGRNPNVFYELAVRHVFRKPFIQITEEGVPIPFDVSALRNVQLNCADMDSVARCKDELTKHIQAIESNPSDVQSPVTLAFDTQILRASAKPIDHLLADILGAISDVKGQVNELMTRQEPLVDANWNALSSYGLVPGVQYTVATPSIFSPLNAVQEATSRPAFPSQRPHAPSIPGRGTTDPSRKDK